MNMREYTEMAEDTFRDMRDDMEKAYLRFAQRMLSHRAEFLGLDDSDPTEQPDECKPHRSY